MSEFIEKLRFKIWHPYLIILYFVLKNAVDIHLPMFQWIEAIGIFIILSSIIFLILFIVKRTPLNALKMSLIITSASGILLFLLPIFSTFNYLYPSVFERVRQVLLFSAIIWLILRAFILLNKKKSFIGVNYYLNVLLITFCIWEIGKSGYESLMVSEETFSNVDTTTLKPKYSIYLIVPDGYASSKNLKNYWQFDNAEFDNYLSQKGFFKASNSHSNYKYTVLTMGSSLNMTYFASRSEPYIASQIKRNQTCKVLDKLNYDCFMLDFNGNNYKYDSKNTQVDFKLLLYMQSAAYLICESLGVEVFKDSYMTNNKVFTQFESYLDASKKQFIYIHSMITHPPFYDSAEKSPEKNDTTLSRILGKMGSDEWLFRKNTWRSIGSPQDDEYLKQIYLSKIKYTNQQIQNTLDKNWDTLKNSIVIVMSDHGFRELPGSIQDVKAETYTNYCAIYYPDKDYSALNDTITPINVIRMALNKAIDSQLKYIPDRTNL